MNETQNRPVPKGVVCPRCKAEIQNVEGVTPGGQGVFRKGLIIVCASCAQISQVGDSQLMPMSVNQVRSLPEMTQKMLFATCNSIAVKATERN